MSARTWVLGFVCSLIGITVGTTTACSSKADHTNNGNIANNSDDAESDGGNPDEGGTPARADAGTSGAGCVATGADDPDDNFTDSNCDGIDGDKSKAIFVAKTGSDTADGSIDLPVATLSHGIELASAKGKDVYVCKGDYSQDTIQLNTKGVRVYGGYDCSAKWVRNSQSQAHLVSTSSTAVSIKDVGDAVVFDQVDITAANGEAGSESSIAVFVSNSKNVTLRLGTLAAGSGADGVQPVTPANDNSLPACFAYVYATGGCFGEPGTDAYQFKNCFYNGQAGGGTIMTAPFADLSVFDLAPQSTDTQKNICSNSTYSIGGRGGGTDPNNPRVSTSGTKGTPPSTSSTLNGNDGATFSPGAAATLGFGTLNASGYFASNLGTAGTDGAIGEAGTGGNGGGFTAVFSGGTGDFPYYLYAPSAGGGKGGWGGCGGVAGAAGNAGGASIAVAVLQSQVSLERTTLVTSSGGKGSAGGLGADGASGQPGGVCGTAYYECSSSVAGEEAQWPLINKTNTGSAQSGGHGGKGGHGSQGGPGGGGPSIPLVVSGAAPTLSAVTFLPGSGGPGGSDGGPRATDGESTDQKALP